MFDTMQHYCAVTKTTMRELTHNFRVKDGLTLRRTQAGRTLSVILYNADTGYPRRLRFTLAHEIGHVYMEHKSDGDVQEREANCFAAQLLLPRILVEQMVLEWGDAANAKELSAVFDISVRAAENRLKSLRYPADYTGDDRALLRKFGGLLPVREGPLVTV